MQQILSSQLFHIPSSLTQQKDTRTHAGKSHSKRRTPAPATARGRALCSRGLIEQEMERFWCFCLEWGFPQPAPPPNKMHPRARDPDRDSDCSRTRIRTSYKTSQFLQNKPFFPPGFVCLGFAFVFIRKTVVPQLPATMEECKIQSTKTKLFLKRPQLHVCHRSRQTFCIYGWTSNWYGYINTYIVKLTYMCRNIYLWIYKNIYFS